MATSHTADPAADPPGGGVKTGFAAFGSITGAMILVMNGILQILEGVSALSDDRIIVLGQQYAYQWTPTGWGWIHVVLGALIALIGLAVMTGSDIARVFAIILACLAIITNFLWLPYYPWWSVLLIALNMFVIWALATWQPRRA